MKMNQFQCILCGSECAEPFYPSVRDSEEFEVVKCSSCGHVQLFPVPTIDEDRKFYDKDKQVEQLNLSKKIDAIKQRSFKDMLRRKKLVESLMDDGKFLLNSSNFKGIDVGTGYGLFVDLMRNSHYNFVGLEPSDSRRSIAKEVFGVPVYKNLSTASGSTDNQYDVITLFHVLEHISHPMQFLRNLKNHLKPDGVMVIEVPNVEDFMLTLSEGYKNFYFQRAHISYFSYSTLQETLLSVGLNVAEVKYDQRYDIFNSMNWLINNQPQMGKKLLSEIQIERLDWLVEFYSKTLVYRRCTDTVTAIVKNTGE